MKLRPGERRRIDKGIYARGRSDGSVIYGIRFEYRGKQVRINVGPTVTQARRALAVKKAEIAQGRFSLPTRSPAFRSFAVQYLEHAKTNKASWRIDAERLKPLTAFFGDRALATITPWHVEQYKAARRAHVSPRTVNIELTILRRMFTLARTWGVAPDNPVAEVRRFREIPPTIRIITETEEKRLLEASPFHLRATIILALNTGLRLGELRALTPNDARDGVLHIRSGKTSRVRVIPLNRKAQAVVDAAVAAGTPTILSYQGKPLGRIYRTWYKTIRKANLPGLRIHDLRHTFASRLVRAGVDLATVRDLLGHSTLQMTSRYSHSGLDQKRAATAILEG